LFDSINCIDATALVNSKVRDMKFVLGKKSGMTTIYDERGAHNVTLITVEPNVVDMVREQQKDGYSAVRLSVAKTRNVMHQKEFRVDDASAYTVSDTIDASIFVPGDVVNVSGDSKAKGFQGVVKRHGFAGGPKTHGHRHVLRQPGSIGSAFPEHVIKGKKMAGRMGGERVTSRNLKVIAVEPEKNLIAVKGAVPGVVGRMVEVVSVA
jgi:large subunit ribosomal protein L3